MHKLTHSLAAKAAAVILTCIFIAVFALSLAGVIIGVNYNVYADAGKSLKDSIFSSYAYAQADRAVYGYYQATLTERDNYGYYYTDGEYYTYEDYEYQIKGYREIFSPENANFFFSITDETGKEVLRNYYESDYCYSDTMIADVQSPDGVKTVTINFYVPSELTAEDSLYYRLQYANLLIEYRYAILAVCIASFVLTAAFLIFLICAAGHRKGTDEIVQGWLDRIPLDLYAALIAIIIIISAAIAEFSALAMCILAFCLWSPLVISFIMTFASRAKYGAWWRNTLIFMLCRLIKFIFVKIFRGLRYLARHISLFWKTLIIYSGISLIEFIAILAAAGYYYGGGILLVLWFLEKLIITPALIFAVINLQKLKAGGERIARGDISYKVDTQHMFWDFKRHGENLNSINEAVQKAVDERMKSEHFRTELITNVSHDIKTPLTSIVNYVDLLKKEDISPERAKEYVEVLDRQSARLRKLTEDLVEASKVSSGTITADIKPTDLNVLIEQVNGEYSRRFEDAGLESVVTMPEQPVYAMADGRLLWRIMDNVMGNVCKYALERTRVYIQLSAEGGRAVISVKNISRQRLNIDASELMERFVRGDLSRNTEGSGLGLNIAGGLAKLQKGSFDISIDGDLFKVEIRLALAGKSEPAAEAVQDDFSGAFKPRPN